MRKSIAICLSLFLAAQGFAQRNLEAGSSVSIYSDFNLRFLLNAHADKNKNAIYDQGYRIHIMSSINREEVYSEKGKMLASFIDVPFYIIYDQPYYKLRMGDYITKLEAIKQFNELIKVYPTSYIVKDEIRLPK